MSKDTIYIIDTFSLMFQVFHAIPPMTGTQGQPTNAVFGFTRDIFGILERKPTHLVCAFDSPGEGRRNEIYAQYKANRTEMPEDLRPQIPMLKELLAGFRIPAIEFPSWEADDVIATITRQAVEKDLDVVIVSSDKDIRQLLGPRVRLFNCRKNEFLDEAGLLADWGVRADQVIDYQSLVGDAVDNVPGIPKVGPKTARSLIEQFGTLDDILSHADQVSGKALQKNLIEFADLARISRELVRLRTDLPIDLDFEEARVTEPDRNALFQLFNRLGFRRYSSMMRPASPSPETSSPESPSQVSDTGGETDPASAGTTAGKRATGMESQETSIPVQALPILRQPAEVSAFLESLSQSPQVLLDARFSTGFLPDRRMTLLTMSDVHGRAGLISERELKNESVMTAIGQWLSEYKGEIITENAKSLQHVLLNRNLNWRASFFDTSIADYLLDAGARSHDLQEVTDRHGDGDLTNLNAAPARKAKQKTMFDDESADEDSGAGTTSQRLSALGTVAGRMKQDLAADQLAGLLSDLELPLLDVLSRMEHRGITVDAAELQQQSQSAGVRIEELTAAIYETAETSFNIDSPRQLSEILFTRLKLPVIKKTKTGASTDQEVLEALAAVHPLPAMIIERRQLTKLKGTYLDALPQLIHPRTRRIHATFHQTVAATGRLSSSDPNLQNIPVRTKEGQRIRKAFQPGQPDWLLLCADYSQIELRILAHFSQDPALLDAFQRGVDIHAAVAADVFQVPVDQVNSDQRRVAKAVNFGVIYGQSSFGLSAALGIERDDASTFIEDYFARYQGVAAFFEKVLTETARTGFARTILNRRRAISGIRKTTGLQKNMSERTAINTVIQGSAADLIKQAMITLEPAISSSGLRAAMLLQIHDELVFEVHRDDADALAKLVVDRMVNAMDLSVPLVVDASTGPNWLDQTDLA